MLSCQVTGRWTKSISSREQKGVRLPRDTEAKLRRRAQGESVRVSDVLDGKRARCFQGTNGLCCANSMLGAPMHH